MKKNLKKRNKKGFTLIELVVVIAILGILAAILIPVIGGFIKSANLAADQANARNLFNSSAILISTDREITDTNLEDYISLPNSIGTLSTNATGTPGAIGDDSCSVGVINDVVVWAQYGGSVYNADGTFNNAS